MSDERVLHKTPAGILCLVHLEKSWGFKDNTPKFSMMLLLEQGVPAVEAWRSAMLSQMEECVKEEWPNEKTRPRKPVNPIKNGDLWEGDDGIPKIEKWSYIEGMYVIGLSEYTQPTLLSIDGRILKGSDQVGVFKDGTVAMGLFDMYAYDNVSKGVSFGLKAVKKIAEGEKLINTADTGTGGYNGVSDAEVQNAFGIEPTDPDVPDSKGAKEAPKGSMFD
jgi:hypothetical protein